MILVVHVSLFCFILAINGIYESPLTLLSDHASFFCCTNAVAKWIKPWDWTLGDQGFWTRECGKCSLRTIAFHARVKYLLETFLLHIYIYVGNKKGKVVVNARVNTLFYLWCGVRCSQIDNEYRLIMLSHSILKVRPKLEYNVKTFTQWK